MRIYLFLLSTLFNKKSPAFFAEEFYHLSIYRVMTCNCLTGG